MKPCVSNQKTAGLTLMEVLVIVVVLIVLAAMLLPSITTDKRPATLINCNNNLKQVGLAYRIWANDHNDKYPMQVSIAETNGGTLGLAGGGNAWINYAIMSNELTSPKILWCPTDTRKTQATNFTTDFNNGRISYFVGLNADPDHPQTLLSGDDNFQVGGVPVKPGLLEIYSNTPIAWTTERHNRRGILGLGDGSTESATVSGLKEYLLAASLATNHLTPTRLAIP